MRHRSRATDSSGWFNKLLGCIRGSSTNSARPCPHRTALRLELLENRSLLSVDLLPYLSGTAFHDLTNDGLTADDVRLPGVTIDLYKDGGNGRFDAGASAGDDVLIGAAVTDANGQYRFTDLTAGTYFVKQLPASGLAFASGQNVATIPITAAETQGVQGTVIDTFDTTIQSVTVSRLGEKVATSTLPAPEAIGGYRDLYAQLTSQYGDLSLDANDDIPGVLDLSSGPMADGNFRVTWDGAPSASGSLNPTGLNHVDLTGRGANRAIQFTLGADHTGASLVLKVFTDAGNWSQATSAFPSNATGSPSATAVIPFSDFVVGGGSGADFANVGAIEIDMSGVSAVDAQIGQIATTGPKVFTENFANVTEVDLAILKSAAPNPAVAGNNLTYTLAATNNGPSDATGVTVVDTLPPEVTYLSTVSGALATSFANGVVTIQLGNLGRGQTASATVSVAVQPGATGTLTNTAVIHGNEPESNLANNTATVSTPVNQQADLAILKSAAPSPAVAGNNLTYTLTATNNGPSNATGVTVVDTLPSGVSYVSAVSSQGAATFAGGTLSVNLGGLANGRAATITVTVAVNSDATGTLANTALIHGNEPDPNSTNNTATAVTPLQSLVDLAITKVASEQEVKPGEAFTYTLTAQNLGPSLATGVRVSDPLPAGVTFVSASSTRGALSSAGSTVAVDVGDLPAGQSLTVTVQVTVAANAVGTLTNSATVSGSQAETTLSNNYASAAVEVSSRVVSEVNPKRLSKRLFLGR